MPRQRDDQRFRIVDPKARRPAARKRAFVVDAPALVPLRVIASAAPVARGLDVEESSAVDVALPDGTRLRFPPGASATFVVEILAALRSVSAC